MKAARRAEIAKRLREIANYIAVAHYKAWLLDAARELEHRA